MGDLWTPQDIVTEFHEQVEKVIEEHLLWNPVVAFEVRLDRPPSAIVFLSDGRRFEVAVKFSTEKCEIKTVELRNADPERAG